MEKNEIIKKTYSKLDLDSRFIEETFSLLGVKFWNTSMTRIAFNYLEKARKEKHYIEPEPTGDWDLDAIVIARSVYDQCPHLREKMIKELKSAESIV